MFRNRIPSTYPIPDTVIRRDGNPKLRCYQFQSCISPDTAFAHHSDTSAVKRLLANFDIMALIFKHFTMGELEGHSTQERMELRGLMLTSKLFFHHAAKALWGAHMDTHGLHHLLNILDLCPISERVSRPDTPELAKRANTAFVKGIHKHICWNHFLYYASLIRSILVNAATLQPGCIAVITSLIPDNLPLLCSLRQLFWEESGHGEELLFLAGGSLEVLSIGILDPRDDYLVKKVFAEWINRLCEKLVCLAPGLKFLQIAGCRAFLQHESALHYFGRLHKTPVSMYGINNKKESYEVQGNWWAALEEVTIHSQVGSSTLACAFKSIWSFVTETLHSVKLHSELAAWPHDSTQFLWLAEPVLTIAHLVCVEISLPNYLLAFTARDLLAIAEALPAVKVLHLSTDALFALPNIPTFTTLGKCLRFCLNLSILYFPIVQGPQHSFESLAIPAPACHRLAALNIGRVRLSSTLSLNMAWNMMHKALLNTLPQLRERNIILGSLGWIGDIGDDGTSSNIADDVEDFNAPSD
ncbi:hypothetical protein BN946_scf184903.g10 [Trametes cinnabarina]|uniref:Uncharacterized protein n=1 Tax=Pycnoporus cinnabarinus TaxID=5643 RepID=A0A060SXE2_PYCCI|nr:hypothetical protein BN946_scf184903.g10 [Trametes cinnabarina]